MADAFVSIIIQRLASMAEQKVRLVVGVKKEVGKLTSNLHAIQDVLEDAERRQVKEDPVKHWLDKLIEVAYDIDDVLIEWNTAILKMQIEGDDNASKPKRKVCSFIFSPCFCYTRVALRHDIVVKIKELNERLDVIVNENHYFNFTLMRGNEELKRQMTASVIDVSEVQGRDHDKKRIVDMLFSESSQTPILRTISIVGMGGIGKTTLSQLVYNDDTVKAHFQIRIWVCVSYPFDEIRIAKAILEELEDHDPNLNEFNSLLGRIHHSIKGKRFLLVLDDVWTEVSTKWEPLKNSLKCGFPGSRILITTRNENVAIIMGTTDIDKFPLGTLSKEDCWSLFSQVAFYGLPSEECEKFKDIGWEIVDKCKGLPLAAKTLGSLLRFKRTRAQWRSVLDSEIWKLQEVKRDLFVPLLLSYYELSSTMRRCFSYCAIFLKGHLLDKDELIKLWIAQGYLKTTESEEIEIIGEDCFEKLAMHSFFQDFEKDENGSITNCKMHNIVHDFAQFLTKNECLVMKVNPFEELRIESSHEKARHLNLMLSGDVSIPMSIYNLKNLRSLIVKSRASPQFDFGLPKSFGQLTCLRSLDFSDCGLKELPREVGKLILLRYLNLSHNYEIKALPETVCELCNLQFLNVAWCTYLKQLPHGIGNLINLRHLKVRWTSIKYMPKGVARLTSLRTLDSFVVSDGDNDGEACTLEDLKNLKHLRGELWIKELGNARDMGEAEKAQLKNMKHLISLRLIFGIKEVERRMINDEQVIEAIQPPPNLEELSISNYRGTRLFPNGMISLTNLKEFQIRFCLKLEALPDQLLRSTSLKQLDISFSSILEKRYYKERKGDDWPKISHIPNIIINNYYVQKEGRLLQKPENIWLKS